MAKHQRKYSDDERAEVLAVLASNNNNQSRTSRETGVPTATIRVWQKSGVNPDVLKSCDEKKEELSNIFEHVARVYLANALETDKIDKTSGNASVISAATAVDKMRLLREQPTSIAGEAKLNSAAAAIKSHIAANPQLTKQEIDELVETMATTAKIPAADISALVH